MSPLQGQSEAQQSSDAEECDSEAKTLSGYDRGVEAKTWLWGIPATVGVVTTWAAQTETLAPRWVAWLDRPNLAAQWRSATAAPRGAGRISTASLGDKHCGALCARRGTERGAVRSH